MTDKVEEPSKTIQDAKKTRRPRTRSPARSSAEMGTAKAPSVSEESQERRRRQNRPFPGRSLEDCIKVVEAIKTQNAGNPWPPEEVARAVKIQARSSNFGELIRSCNSYNIVSGTYRAPLLAVTELGRRLAYPLDSIDLTDARKEALLSVDLFKRVIQHYNNGEIPQSPFINNTLTREFDLTAEFHDEFVRILRKNIDYVGGLTKVESADEQQSQRQPKSAAQPDKARPGRTKLRAFVIMPFSERPHAGRSEGFHKEVFASIIRPACELAGFEAATADRRGSDIIHATILREIVEADLVVADLTDQNPNVMFELGLRMAIGSKPVSILKSKDTGPVFDVDNILRTYEYNHNLWPSTVDADVPEYAEFIKASWESRNTGSGYVEILTGKSGG